MSIKVSLVKLVRVVSLVSQVRVVSLVKVIRLVQETKVFFPRRRTTKFQYILSLPF